MKTLYTEGKPYYFKVPGLLVPPGRLTYEQVHSDINKYIDNIPSLTESIEKNFVDISHRADRLKYFQTNMDITIMLLRNVFARYLEKDAMKILRCVNTATLMPVAEKMMKPFIAALLSLSIDMQKAQSSAADKASASVAETNAGVAENLAALAEYIEDGEFAIARYVAEEIKEGIPGDETVKLLDLITNEKYDEARTLAASLEEKFTKDAGQFEADLSKKILVVDDRPEILSFVNDALKNHYKVFGARSGETAIKVMKTQTLDLFILDIDMPVMNGFELATAIRKDINYKKTPIVFLTGNSARERVDKAVEVGGNDFIVKPATHGVLLRKAGMFLSS